MEPVLFFLGSWWWIAPTAAGLGAVGYGAVTMPRRRARRLELDAARHDQYRAYQALQSARADVRAARADALSAKAARGGVPFAATPPEERRAIQAAKAAERAAAMHLRASRDRLKAVQVRFAQSGRSAPLPLEQLLARHDAIAARWLVYETDAGAALSFPQMLDARHPSTHAFLRAQHDAQRLRPATARAKMTAAQFVEYRDAVGAMEAAFDVAERDAQDTARRGVAGLRWNSPPPAVTPPTTAQPTSPQPTSAQPTWPVPSRRAPSEDH